MTNNPKVEGFKAMLFKVIVLRCGTGWDESLEGGGGGGGGEDGG